MERCYSLPETRFELCSSTISFMRRKDDLLLPFRIVQRNRREKSFSAFIANTPIEKARFIAFRSTSPNDRDERSSPTSRDGVAAW